MWATERHPEHEGIVGVTFDSEGNRLVGTLYLARGEEPKPTVLLLHGCPAGVGLDPKQVESEFTRFLAATPPEFPAQLDEVARRMDPLEAVAAIAPRPLLVVHGTEDRWVPAGQARELRDRAKPPCRYVEMRGANHAFAWHRAGLRDLIAGWLDEAF